MAERQLLLGGDCGPRRRRVLTCRVGVLRWGAVPRESPLVCTPELRPFVFAAAHGKRASPDVTTPSRRRLAVGRVVAGVFQGRHGAEKPPPAQQEAQAKMKVRHVKGGRRVLADGTRGRKVEKKVILCDTPNGSDVEPVSCSNHGRRSSPVSQSVPEVRGGG
eukprot:CAMPEP_0172058700 /NCGR_PEP_ID=MMETSP1043-20130122/6998_1 /TAXON_ID=464988 /ORGANISM="Hemiselmis andersenii, Strain CCMP441" /LENGTH=161 /DNA_ID=CAMNT_0012718271 /DNA_START=117 /DNA_END=598 /DNA_ORIENTATION=-